MEAANRLWTSLRSWKTDENRVFHNLNQLLLSDWSRETSEIAHAFTCEGCQVALGQLVKNTLQCNTYSKSNTPEHNFQHRSFNEIIPIAVKLSENL